MRIVLRQFFGEKRFGATCSLKELLPTRPIFDRSENQNRQRTGRDPYYGGHSEMGLFVQKSSH
ncbi:hypothetical protein D3C71_2189880 [compost metagenome]